MESRDFSSYYDKPCRIKLKSGKEVFGVIWKGNTPNSQEHFFASSKEYEAYKKALLDEEYSFSSEFSKVNLSEVVSVESLENILGKD